VHVSALSFNPFFTITPRPELAQAIPTSGQGEGFTSYTWYDHPFVLRVVFGRYVASLGSINSCATIARPLPATLGLDDEAALAPLRAEFSRVALAALNNLIAVVRRQARLYHVFDLQRDDIDISIRNEEGLVLRPDPLEAALIQKEEQGQSLDLLAQNAAWYEELAAALQRPEPVSLAEDLLMEAERALTQRFPRQAITTCHTSIETAASALLNRGMSRRGIPDAEIDYILTTKSLTNKLDALLIQYTGSSLKKHNHSLWGSFNKLNDLRNDIVHRGKNPTNQDAELVIGITRELLRWLAVLRSQNK
jgi:hypothetical protein